MTAPTQIYAYSWIIGNQTDGAQGTLYAGTNRLPLPILDSSPRLQQRIAFAMLFHAFEGEEHAEQKAYRLHKQFARRFVATSSWGITAKDFNDTLAACLVEFYQRRLPVKVVLRDFVLRDPCRPHQKELFKGLTDPSFTPRERLTLLSATTLN